MRWKEWFKGVLWLLAAPSVVLALFMGWTHWLNAATQSGPLRVGVEPQVVLPWQGAELRLSVHDEQSADAPDPEPVDMVLLVDVSGSMHSSLDAMAKAVRKVAADVADGKGGNRFALVRFDSEALIEADWTAVPAELDVGLGNLEPITGTNSAGPAFERLEELLRGVRPEATPVAVWYTDGVLDACYCKSLTNDQIAAASDELRQRGVEIFAVAPPSLFGGGAPLLARMTGSTARVFEPVNIGQLGRSFRAVAGGIWTSVGREGRLEQRIDGRHFETPLGGTEWRRGSDGTLVRDLDLLLDGGVYRVPLEPQSAGLWRVGLEPSLLSYLPDQSSDPVQRRAGRRPALLVVSWWTLLWLLLPALLWAGGNLPRRAPAAEEEAASLPPVLSPSLPSQLPALPGPVSRSLDAVPTLFIGLGGAGRRALQPIRAELDELSHGVYGPWSFLGLDLDRRPVKGGPAPEAHTVLAPPAVARVGGYLPSQGQVPETWSWFDAVSYHDTSREDLNLVEGSRGDRALARLALFRWLDTGGLLAELRHAFQHLAGQPAVHGLRQVVILASRDGGMSGAFVDLGRMAQRLGRELQSAGEVDFAPEVIGLLCEDEERPHDENRQALAVELQTAMLAGAHPIQTDYGDSDPILSGQDNEAPFHGLTAVAGKAGRGPDALDDQCAQLAAVLVESGPRRGLLRSLADLTPGDEASRPSEICLRSLQLLPTLDRRRLQLHLLQRLLGPDVLFDIVAGGDGYVPRSVDEDEIEGELKRWCEEEIAGAPLGLLLAARHGERHALDALDAAAARWPAYTESWLDDAVVAAVNRRLHGSDPGGGWRRGWGPSVARAVLGRLTRHMQDLGKGSAAYAPMASHLVDLTKRLTAALEDWLQSGCAAGAALDGEQRELDRRLEQLEALPGRFLLACDRQEGHERVREALEVWLGGVDTVARLRQHLFPALELAAGEERIVVRDHVEEPRRHLRIEELTARLEQLSVLLASSRSSRELEKVLGQEDEEQRAQLARQLVDRQARPDVVLVARPDRPSPDATPHVDALVDAIPHPAGHGGERRVLESGDAASLRRLEVSVEAAPDSAAGVGYAHGPEVAAERMRRRLERKYQIAVPVLPAALRLALARPGRFRRFGEAYRMGRVVRRPDETGKEQWYSLDGDRFLTFGRRSTLADAAAQFTIHNDPPGSGSGSEAGDFSALEQWLRDGGAPAGDAPVLAAIEAVHD